MDKIRVLVVDDSFFMRKAIAKIINSEEIEVIDTAVNGREGYEKAKALKPDLITMDIEMPEMTGLEALEAIMKEVPTPVIMLSSLTKEGAEQTLQALTLGALDFVTKKNAFNEIDSIKEELTSKIKNIHKNNEFKNQLLRRTSLLMNKRLAFDSETDESSINQAPSRVNPGKGIVPKESEFDIIAIGISTGGPAALMTVIPQLASSIDKPILIAQHMPPNFTASLAERLNLNSSLNVKEGEDSEYIKKGTVYIAPGGMQMKIKRGGKLIIDNEPETELYKPSVNVLFNSINDVYGGRAFCIIMTGMGKDGAKACTELSKSGAYIAVQEPASCVVPGMPNAIISGNLDNTRVALKDMAKFINSIFA